MAQLRGSTGDEQLDMEYKQALVEGSLEQLFAVYDEGVADGLQDPVVVLLDCRDEIGNRLARAWAGGRAIEQALAEHASEDEEDLTVTLALALPFDDCRSELPAAFPYLAETFDKGPPRAGFLAVAVTCGGAATFTVPLAARPHEGEF